MVFCLYTLFCIYLPSEPSTDKEVPFRSTGYAEYNNQLRLEIRKDFKAKKLNIITLQQSLDHKTNNFDKKKCLSDLPPWERGIAATLVCECHSCAASYLQKRRDNKNIILINEQSERSKSYLTKKSTIKWLFWKQQKPI